MYSSEVYLGSQAANKMKIKVLLPISLFYSVTLMVSIGVAFLGGLLVFPISRHIALFSKYAGLVFLVLVSIAAFRDIALGFRGTISIVVLLGVCIGLWISFIRLRKQGRLK